MPRLAIPIFYCPGDIDVTEVLDLLEILDVLDGLVGLGGEALEEGVPERLKGEFVEEEGAEEHCGYEAAEGEAEHEAIGESIGEVAHHLAVVDPEGGRHMGKIHGKGRAGKPVDRAAPELQ